ncbi:MAG: hypothetical protein IKU46_10815, partial [Peptococcaceae bacterium]|nr:hypothetical protein [Peptococcaceae bacterium]
MNAIICGLLYIQADSGYLYRIYRRWNCWLKPEVHYNTMCIVTAPILVTERVLKLWNNLTLF